MGLLQIVSLFPHSSLPTHSFILGSSSVVTLYEAKWYVKLLQVDYTALLPSGTPVLDEVRPPSTLGDRIVHKISPQLDSRITSLMVVKNQLWLGTGKGVVAIFSVSEAVPEVEAAIAQLVQRKSEQVVQAQQPATAGQGLLTPEITGGSEEAPSAVRDSPYQNRRTAFGRTLHGPPTKSAPKKSPSVFQLQFESTFKIVHAESVRVLLSLK